MRFRLQGRKFTDIGRALSSPPMIDFLCGFFLLAGLIGLSRFLAEIIGWFLEHNDDDDFPGGHPPRRRALLKTSTSPAGGWSA
jgi:hypothetical protein